MSDVLLDDSEEEVETKPYGHHESQYIQKLTHFYISSEIAAPAQYIPMIHKLHTASQGETIFFHLNTNGGDLDSTLQIVNAIKISHAHVVASIESSCHSAGTLIFLAADEQIVMDNSIMMIHNYSSGTSGKGSEMKSEVDASVVWFENLVDDFYTGFLSKTEIKKILAGEDKWIQCEDIKKRLKKVKKS